MTPSTVLISFWNKKAMVIDVGSLPAVNKVQILMCRGKDPSHELNLSSLEFDKVNEITQEWRLNGNAKSCINKG
jgi:hypothetical protein